MSEVENLLDEAEQRIGLYRDELVDVLAGLREALRALLEVCDEGDGPAYHDAQAALKAAEELLR